MLTLGIAGMGWALVFGILALAVSGLPDAGIAAIPLVAGSLGGAAVALWAGIQLVRGPRARLCLFRDRLLVIEGRHEMRAVWKAMGAVTLTEPQSWPDVRLTDRLTIQLRNEAPLRLKPAAFGLRPAACRDLILRLRDEPELRARLPEFDSLRDLAVSPVVAGELIDPRL